MDVIFQKRVDELAHEVTELCYHCHKCTAGCPVSYAMEYGPDRILRMVQLGQKETVLASPDIWLCAGCETCGASTLRT
jgi:heterodisulfide reductase subunit C